MEADLIIFLIPFYKKIIVNHDVYSMILYSHIIHNGEIRCEALLEINKANNTKLVTIDNTRVRTRENERISVRHQKKAARARGVQAAVGFCFDHVDEFQRYFEFKYKRRIIAIGKIVRFNEMIMSKTIARCRYEISM